MRFIAALGLLAACETEAPRSGVVASVEFGGGLCAYGACSTVLWLDDEERVALDGFDADGSSWTQSGALTDAGTAELGSIEVDLDPESFDAVYGCPGCADGGAITVEFQVDGAVVTTQYEQGAPPDGLEDLDAFAEALFLSLRACVSDERVDVDGSCDPVGR